MIPVAAITAWRALAPWPSDAQVEQDLVLSRALVEIYSDALLAESLAFRGGTALHKLHVRGRLRYSEDLDFVHTAARPIGPVLSALRERLSPWLGAPRNQRGRDRVTVIHRFDSEIPPVRPLRLKVEIHTREHVSRLGHRFESFTVDNPWFRGDSTVRTFVPEELLATKLRALYQRKKGRDLFDLAIALDRIKDLDPKRTVSCFLEYMAAEGHRVTRAEFEANLAGKLADPAFVEDVEPLIAQGNAPSFDRATAAQMVRQAFVARIPEAARRMRQRRR